jgi:hypothetical protein
MSMIKSSNQPGALKLTIARRHADEYDNLITQSHEACDCQDCEACIRLGIQVVDWIIEADEGYRRALYDDPKLYDEETEKMLEFLMRRWQQKCETVIQWAQRNVDRGFTVNHFDEFKKRCASATAIVESLDDSPGDRVMSEPLIVLRDQALDDHRNGQTADFI